MMFTEMQKDELIEALIDTYKERFGTEKTVQLLYDIGLREKEMYYLGIPAEVVDRVLNNDDDVISISNGVWVTQSQWEKENKNV